MILDKLANSARYNSLHPMFEQAFEYLKNNDLANIPTGKVVLVEDKLIVNIVDAVGKTADEARMETHRDFIDIQVPVGTTETMGCKAAADLTPDAEGYNAEKDLSFFDDKATTFCNIKPYEFAIFFPEDGHQPGIAEGTFRKVIVKVRA